MTVAFLMARLCTLHMLKRIGQFQCTGVSSVLTTAKLAGKLRAEMEVWLELRKQLYKAGWYKALSQVLSVTGDYTRFVVGLGRSNARPLRGGVQGSRRFSSGTISEHITLKDGYDVLASLHSILRDTTPRK